jgi:leader peptidase (prepilin peptidase)/N-methyltransferase
MWAAGIFILGLIIGSFLNVIIYRMPRGISVVRPGSMCPECGHPLSWPELIPWVGFILNKGVCRYCRHKLPYIYPAVETITALGFLLVYLQAGISLNMLSGFVFTAVLICAAFIDGQWGIIPDRITLPAAAVGLLLAPFTVGFLSGLIGLVFFGGLLFMVAFVSRGGLGGGDVKLALSIGVFCGWPLAWGAFFLSYLFAAIYGGALLLSGRADRKTAIKFGPFLALGSWLAWVCAGSWFSGWGF